MIFSRWMGPELFGDLAVVLTIKLALLGVLGAVQMAVSQMIAQTANVHRPRAEQALARINRYCFAILWLALPPLAAAMYFGSFDTHLEISSPYLLFILLGSLPFCAPLNILRGVALGKMESGKIILSANVEMFVRMVASIFAWKLGFGIEGVVFAIVLSIIAGWAVITNALPTPRPLQSEIRPMIQKLGLTALPFGLLQVAQVASLDGDVFLATRFLSEIETGYVAALSLFQRIQFFACFALAGVMLPIVVKALNEGTSYRSHVVSIAGLLGFVSTIVLTGAFFQPELLLNLLVGPAYIAAAPLLWIAAAAAVVFTINYLLATFLMALGSQSGIGIVTIGAVLQISGMLFALVAFDANLAQMLIAKLTIQIGIFVLLALALFNTPLSQSKLGKN